MGKIFAAPAEIKAPVTDYRNFEAAIAADEKYVREIKEWAKRHGKGQYAGEEIRFQVADGYARYVVFSARPLALIHLPVGDAWQFQYAARLTAKDVAEQVDRQRSIARLFANKA